MSHSPKTSPDPHPGWKGRTWRLLRPILLAYLVVLLMLSWLQRSLMYVPSHAANLNVAIVGVPKDRAEDLQLTTPDGLLLHGWHFLPAGISADNPAEFNARLKDSGQRVCLFLPGNGGHRQYREDEFRLLTALGLHVVAFDYRGYGENPGSPSESGLATDAAAVWNWLTIERGVEPSRIVIYGESLGGAVATRLAAERSRAGQPPAGLILRSTFSSMVDAAGVHYPWLPVSWLLKDRYPSVERIRDVVCPILILHGARDRVVPLPLGQRLFAAAPAYSATGVAKRWVELTDGDHNDILIVEREGFLQAVREFLAELK